jgi:hypothetical protein
MGRTLLIGQNACYWSASGKKPLPAICIDCEDGNATLVVFTAAGGRFVKTVGPKQGAQGEGWGEVGQVFH